MFNKFLFLSSPNFQSIIKNDTSFQPLTSLSHNLELYSRLEALLFNYIDQLKIKLPHLFYYHTEDDLSILLQTYFKIIPHSFTDEIQFISPFIKQINYFDYQPQKYVFISTYTIQNNAFIRCIPMLCAATIAYFQAKK